MKRTICRFRRNVPMLLAILLLALLFPFRTYAEAEKSNADYASQTIMVFIVGADLESQMGAATRDIAEMLKAKADPEKIRVLAMTGGTTKWLSPVIPVEELTIFEIRGNQPKKVHSLPLQSMGKKETLTSFLNYAVSEYPSESYGLILWDHGGGPMVGFGMDERHKGDSLTLLELRDALDDSVFGDGNKLEWIGFDACLMSSAKVAILVSDYARYMIASQETLPSQGWNYAFLKDLGDTSLRGPDIARSIIDTAFAYYDAQMLKQPDWKPALTLSCLSLEHAAALENALNALFAEMDDALTQGSYSVLAQSRDSVKAYGLSTTSQDFDLIDIGGLAAQMEFLYPEKCAALVDSVDRMVLINRTNQLFSKGISLYYPFRNKDYYEKQWKNEYPNFGLAPQYTSFMQHFGDILLSDSLTEWSGSRALQPFYNEERQAYSLQLTPEQAANYDKAYYYLLIRYEGEVYYMHYMSSDVTLDEQLRLTANFDGNVVMIRSPGSDAIAMPVVIEREAISDTGYFQSRVRVVRGSMLDESAAGALRIEANRKAGTAQITGFLLDGQRPGGMTGKNDANLQEWDLIQFVGTGSYLTRTQSDQSGDLLPFSEWEPLNGIRGYEYWIKDGIEAFYGPVEELGEDIFCVIEIVDTQGNRYTSELMPAANKKPASVEIIPPIPDWEPEVIAFDSGKTAAQTLVNRDGVTIELLDVGFDRFNTKLQMRLKIRNENPSDLEINLNKLVVNDASLNTGGSLDVPAQSDGEYTVDIRPITYLQELSINHIHNIDFLFKATTPDYKTLFESAPISVQPDLALPDQIGVGAVPVGHGVIFSEDGASLEITGAYLDEFSLSVEYILRNNADSWDVLCFEDISVNGVNGFIRNLKYVRPGTEAHGRIIVMQDELFPIVMDDQDDGAVPPDADPIVAALKHPEILTFHIGLARSDSADLMPFRKYGPITIDLGENSTNGPEDEAAAAMDIQSPPAADLAGEMSPYEPWTPLIVDAGEGKPRDHAIIEGEEVSVVLTDVGFDGKEEKLQMGFKVGNAAASPVTLEFTNIVVNSTSLFLYTSDIPEVAAGTEAELTQWFVYGGHLRELGIEEIRNIDFLLHVKTSGQGDIFGPVPVSIRTRLPVPVPDLSVEGALPFTRGIVLDQEGLTMEITGAYQQYGYINLQYLLYNSSKDWDWCSFEDVAINGLGDFTGSSHYIMPGTRAHGELSISIDELAKNGITTPAKIEFHIDLTRGGVSHERFRKQIGPVVVQFSGREGYEQSMDTEGKVIVDHEGFALIQLDSDPTGKTFFAGNQTPWEVYLSVPYADELGHGIAHASFSPTILSPNQSVYVHLEILDRNFQPLTTASAPLDLRLRVINKDKNSLMYLPNPITFIP